MLNISKLFLAGLCALCFTFISATTTIANPLDKVEMCQLQDVRVHAVAFPTQQPQGGVMITAVDSVEPGMWRMNFRLDNQPEITLADNTTISIEEFKKVMHQFNWFITFDKTRRQILGLHQIIGNVEKSMTNNQWDQIRFDAGTFGNTFENMTFFTSDTEYTSRKLILEPEDTKKAKIGKKAIVMFNIQTGKVIQIYS